jgi:hypothetical protein
MYSQGVSETASTNFMNQKLKKTRKRRLLRVPAQQDFENYRGGHTFRKWKGLPPDWHCPACRRSRFQLLTWTKSLTRHGGLAPGEYKWLAPLHEHHDHYVDGGVYQPRFSPTLICSDCNSAEGRTKRLLGLPSDFSFSPAEMSRFVTGSPHNGVETNLEIARKIYEVHMLCCHRHEHTG